MLFSTVLGWLNIDYLKVASIYIMKGANLVEVLSSTLNPSTTNYSYQTLSHLKTSKGFAIELLIISDNGNYDISIRQSALIYLKNIVQEHCSQSAFIPQEDIHTLKVSLLQALIRNVTNSKLTPTYREVIFKLAERYYPREWPSIVQDAVGIISGGTDMGGLLGAVQALKAIYSVFGGSVSKEIELSNLCNKSILPLLSLASKLFQNFNQQTSFVLTAIFKLFNTAILFYLPQIVELNIHSFMIFVKKILDLNIDLASNDNTNLYLLKRISLRILFRIFQKHANVQMTQNKAFAEQFHHKYSKSFMETLVLQIMLKVEGDRTAKRRSMQLIKLSLSCLAYINRQNGNAAAMLINNREAIVRLCMEKFRISLTRNYQNFNEFKLYMQESRTHFKQFVFSLINCQAIPQQQGDAVSSILAILLEYLQKGDNQQRELALYLFTEMSTQLQYLTNKLDQKMIVLVLTYVKPLLKEQNHVMIRARACELIASYHYLELPEEQMNELANLIYNCLLVGGGEKELFLKIYACNAFNSIMKYDTIVAFIKPFIPEILKIYTELLQADTSIIKNFEDLINLLEEEVTPFANDLAKLLIGMFDTYTRNDQQICNQNDRNGNREEAEDEEDDQENDEQEDTNNESNARACISSIRQILQASSTLLSEDVRQQLLDLVVWVFSDENQNYIEQGYNVLNLLLYKLDSQADSKYFIFFKVIVYAILGLPKEYVDNLKSKGDNFSVKYAQILSNICIQPDNDIIQNSIGCLRNFLAKSSGNFLRAERDDFNFSCMDYLFKVVRFVHENQSGKSSQTDRLIILTIYITMIEYQIVNQQELGEITSTVMQWMQMEQEVVVARPVTNGNSPFVTFGKEPNTKYVYTSVYLQILLLAVNFYDKATLQQININFLVEKVVALADSFKCDYEISRVIVGFSHILNNQMVGDENLVRMILNALPELVRRLCKLRQEGDTPDNDLDMDDQAEEEKFFGDDENTHLMGWQENGNPTNKDLMLKGEEDDEDNDWEDEFNKFYVSPLDKIDQIKFLEDVMARMGHIYGSYMNRDKQEELSLYLSNAPLKNSQN